MTGLELLEGLSFVDERFIAEADTAVLGRKVPWMKVLSVAACLCILIIGAFALENMGVKEEAAAPAAAAPESVTESAMEEAAPKEETSMEQPESPAAMEKENSAGELEHVPYAVLQIEKVLDDGSFEAIVKAMEPMEMDTPVTLVIDPDMVPDGEPAEDTYLETIPEDMVVQITDGAYDAGSNTLYAEGVFLTEE